MTTMFGLKVDDVRRDLRWVYESLERNEAEAESLRQIERGLEGMLRLVELPPPEDDPDLTGAQA